MMIDSDPCKDAAHQTQLFFLYDHGSAKVITNINTVL